MRSVARGERSTHRSTPVEAIVQANLDGVLVIAEGAGGSDRTNKVHSAKIVVLVFDLARPVLGEQVFETTADSVAVTAAVAAEAVGEARISPAVAALGV